MNEYGKQNIRRLAEGFRLKGLTVKEQSDAEIRVTTRLGNDHVYRWLKEEECSLVSQFPELECAVNRYIVGNHELRYRFYCKKEEITCVFEADFPTSQTDDKHVSLYMIKGSGEGASMSLESLGRAFARWLQQLPEYRLRFVTGEWELIGEFSS